MEDAQQHLQQRDIVTNPKRRQALAPSERNLTWPHTNIMHWLTILRQSEDLGPQTIITCRLYIFCTGIGTFLLIIICSRVSCNTNKSRSFMQGQTRTMQCTRLQSTRGEKLLPAPLHPKNHPGTSTSTNLSHKNCKAKPSPSCQLKIITTLESCSDLIMIFWYGYMSAKTAPV